MKLYTRKSIRVGAFRFTVSKSGVNVSTGIKGFRIGSGPRGNYINISSHGFQYRYTIPNAKPKVTRFSPPKEKVSVFNRAPIDVTRGPRKTIESGNVLDIVDSNSASIVEEINGKKEKTNWIFKVLSVGVLVNLIAAYNEFPLMWLPIALCLLTTAAARYRDVVSKITVVMYDIDNEYSESYEYMLDAFEEIISSGRCWHIEAKRDVYNAKYHAGASNLIERSIIDPSFSEPPGMRTNVLVPCIPVDTQTLYFFPDRVLIYSDNDVGAVSYENLQVHIYTQRFVEEDTLSNDADVVDYTWKYINKRGGPDLRFKENYKIPVTIYDYMHFKSHTGLNECISVSCLGALSDFGAALELFKNRVSM